MVQPVALSSKSAASTSVASLMPSTSWHRRSSRRPRAAVGDEWDEFGMPLVPVVFATPAPVRLNQVSIVKVAEVELGGSPNVT